MYFPHGTCYLWLGISISSSTTIFISHDITYILALFSLTGTEVLPIGLLASY